MTDFRFDLPNNPLPYDAARAEALANPFDEEVRDILWLDVPAAVGRLTEGVRHDGNTRKAYFGRGITLRVTARMAQVIAEDPTDEILAELERSGHSFLVRR